MYQMILPNRETARNALYFRNENIWNGNLHPKTQFSSVKLLFQWKLSGINLLFFFLLLMAHKVTSSNQFYFRISGAKYKIIVFTIIDGDNLYLSALGYLWALWKHIAGNSGWEPRRVCNMKIRCPPCSHVPGSSIGDYVAIHVGPFPPPRTKTSRRSTPTSQPKPHNLSHSYVRRES